MQSEPFSTPGVASSVYGDGVFPLEGTEKTGLSLGERGSLAEAQYVKDQVLADIPKKRGRPKGSKLKPIAENQVHKKRGRPKKAEVIIQQAQAEKALDDPEATVNINYRFLMELVAYQHLMFRVIEQRSSGDLLIVNPSRGGVDLDYGYRLQDRLRVKGLL